MASAVSISALRYSAIGADADSKNGARLAKHAGTTGRALLVPPAARIRDGLECRAEPARRVQPRWHRAVQQRCALPETWRDRPAFGTAAMRTGHRPLPDESIHPS